MNENKNFYNRNKGEITEINKKQCGFLKANVINQEKKIIVE
jgi:hypothetical protein